MIMDTDTECMHRPRRNRMLSVKTPTAAQSASTSPITKDAPLTNNVHPLSQANAAFPRTKRAPSTRCAGQVTWRRSETGGLPAASLCRPLSERDTDPVINGRSGTRRLSSGRKWLGQKSLGSERTRVLLEPVHGCEVRRSGFVNTELH